MASRLESKGVKVWFAEWDIDYGEDIVQRIETGLQQTRIFVSVVSPESLERPWVKKELSAAFRQALDDPSRLIVPVMLRQVEPPAFLAAHKWIDFTNSDRHEERAEELARVLLGRRPRRR